MSGFVSASKETQFRRLMAGGFVRAMAGMLLWGVATVTLPVATMPAVPAAAADEEAHGHGDHVEIGHNPPEGVTKKDFESPAELRTDLAIWSLAVFLLLLGLLGKFAWKPIMEGLDKREQGIEHQIAETKKANEEAKRMLVSYERRLSETADEVRGMLDEARRDAESTKVAIVAEARKAAEEEQARAKHEIGLARDEALSSIALKAGDLAVEVAGKFLREKIGKEDHSRLVRDSIASLGTKPSVN